MEDRVGLKTEALRNSADFRFGSTAAVYSTLNKRPLQGGEADKIGGKADIEARRPFLHGNSAFMTAAAVVDDGKIEAFFLMAES